MKTLIMMIVTISFLVGCSSSTNNDMTWSKLLKESPKTMQAKQEQLKIAMKNLSSKK